MSFQPLLPLSGFGGWAFLNRTLDTQVESFRKSPVIQRDTDYFRENIGKVTTADDLVSDRRLLRVALGAFGLEADIDSRAFIRKILEDGAAEPDALANKLTDKRYLAFSKAFGFGEFEARMTGMSAFPDRIISAYEARQFEVAVGNQDDDMRLALNMRRELSEVAGDDRSERAKWSRSWALRPYGACSKLPSACPIVSPASISTNS